MKIDSIDWRQRPQSVEEIIDEVIRFDCSEAERDFFPPFFPDIFLFLGNETRKEVSGRH